MITADLAQRIKELELHTRRILSGSSIGANRCLYKGFGFEFDQLRSYQHGDDVRLIDWKSSARTNLENLQVRQYLEERNRTFMVCLDISASTNFGSGNYTKHEIMQQIAGVLSLAAMWSKDKVGLILFSDTVELVIPPAKGQVHVHRLLERMFQHMPQGKTTNFDVLCDYVAQYVPAKTTLLVVSDFIAPDFKKSLRKIMHKKDFIAITCLDPQETVLHDVGLVWMQDPETGELALINTYKSNVLLTTRLSDQKSMFFASKIDALFLKNQNTFIHELITFFQKRMVY